MATGLELLTTSQMALADKCAIELGVPSLALMENAGRAVAAVAMRMVPFGARIAILCGPGNNGGDGFVAARVLREAGYDAVVACLVPLSDLKGDARAMSGRWAGETGHDCVAAARTEVVGLIVDALFGAGLARPLSGIAALAVGAINARRREGVDVLAVDVPSGLDGTTGAASGPVVEATETVTFFRRKPGHLLMPGRRLSGAVTVADIGIPPAVVAAVKPFVSANAPALWQDALPRHHPDGHKYHRGHAVVISGGIEMSGAARLCARGALRIGAGLVTVATPPDALLAHASHLNATLLKIASKPDEFRQLLADKRYNAVAIGPGLGRSFDRLDCVLAVLESGAATVLDADALTIAAGSCERLFASIARSDRPVVLTPHEGEFKRLFPAAPGSKLDRARTAAKQSHAIVVLKGADTVIAAPDGRAAINENAPPALATAGSGDVLAGFVTGLIAQGMPAFESACAAVWLHGDCANRFGPGLIAEDIPESLPSVLATLPSD